MDVYGEEMVLIKNSDGTYRIEVHNCPFKDLNGEVNTAIELNTLAVSN